MSSKLLKTFIGACLISLQLSSFSAIAASGGSMAGGGGFKYRDTSLPHLKMAQIKLIESLSLVTEKELNQVSEQLGQKYLDKDKLAQAIKSLKFAPLENRTLKIDGFDQPKDFDTSIDGQYIVALQPIFEDYNIEKLSSEQEQTLRRKIVHEATHLLNIGQENDEDSYNLSKGIIELFKKNYVVCGREGTIEQRIEDCEWVTKHFNELRAYSLFSYVKFGPIVKDIVKNKNIAIRSSEAELGFFTIYSTTEREKGLALDPISFCSKADTLNGKISWKVATFEQVNKLDNTRALMYDRVLLANNKVRIIESGFIKSKPVIENVNEEHPRYTYDGILCIGTRN